MASQVIRTVCPHDCPDQCSMLAHVEEGRLVKVSGDPDHVFTRGFLCAKVNRYPERVYSPERLLYPMRRVGPKGGGQFVQISWDEALDEIAARWKAVGSDALLGYAYSGTMGLVNRLLPTALFHALNAREIALGTVCDSAAEAGWTYSCGAHPGVDPEEVAQSDLIICWGANIVTTNVHLVPFVDEARKRGAKLIVIDPYRTRTATRADWYIPVRVGTDTALALAIIHVLERERLVDIGFVHHMATGWEELRSEVLPHYSPERAEAITGVPAAEIDKLARLLGEAQAPFVKIGTGMSRVTDGGMAVRTVALLPAVVGAWGKPGGGALLNTAEAFGCLNVNAMRRPDLRSRRSGHVVNHSLLGRELQDPTLKAFFVMSNNPAVSCPDQAQVIAGLSREDLFTVVHEIHLTDTARYADIVLPACTAVEGPDLFRSYGHRYFQYAPQVLEPLGESRPNRWVVAELARRMGLEDPVFYRSVPEHVAAVLEGSGFDPEQVMAGGPVRVSNPETLPHTAFYSHAMAEDGLEPLPQWRQDPAAEEEGARYPLRLLTAPGHYQHHTHFAGVESLQQSEGPPRCLIHPADAGARSISDGDEIEIYNDRGQIGLFARVTADTQPGTVVLAGQRAHDRYLGGGSVNALTSSRIADMGGGATYQSTWLEARKRGQQ